MNDFLQLIVTGLTIGVIYAGIALGYSTIFSATGLINFSLGSQAMLAGYFCYVWLDSVPFVVRAIVAVVAGGAISLLSWILAFRHIFRRQGPLATVIATFAFSVAIQELVRIIASGDVRPAISPFGKGVTHTGGVNISHHTIGVVIVGVAMLVLAVLAFRSRWALLAKAIFQDETMSRALGVRTETIVDAIFLLSGAFTAVAGMLLAPLTSVSPYSGVTVALVGFVGAAFGGLGSIQAASLGGLLLGVAQSLFSGYASSNYTDAFVYGLLAVVLVVRPSGLLYRAKAARV